MGTLLTRLCVIALGEELQDQCGSQRMNVEHHFTLILLPAENDSPLTDL